MRVLDLLLSAVRAVSHPRPNPHSCTPPPQNQYKQHVRSIANYCRWAASKDSSLCCRRCKPGGLLPAPGWPVPAAVAGNSHPSHSAVFASVRRLHRRGRSADSEFFRDRLERGGRRCGDGDGDAVSHAFAGDIRLDRHLFFWNCHEGG